MNRGIKGELEGNRSACRQFMNGVYECFQICFNLMVVLFELPVRVKSKRDTFPTTILSSAPFSVLISESNLSSTPFSSLGPYDSKSSITVPRFSLGISPFGPNIRPCFLNRGAVIGVARRTSNGSAVPSVTHLTIFRQKTFKQ